MHRGLSENFPGFSVKALCISVFLLFYAFMPLNTMPWINSRWAKK